MDRTQRLIQSKAKSPIVSSSWGTTSTAKTIATNARSSAYWTCKACSKTMQLHLQASHVSGEEHINRCKQLLGSQINRPLTTEIPNKVGSTTWGARMYGFQAAPPEEEGPIEKTYCDVCRQDYRESKKGPHLTPGWYCVVCDHYMHIISREGHLLGKKHAAVVELQGVQGSLWKPRVVG